MVIQATCNEETDWGEEIEDEGNGYPDSNYGPCAGTPRLVNHGGLCCGIKTIYGLGWSTNDTACELEEVPYNTRDKNGAHVWSSLRFFYEEAPKETYGERVERYIKFLELVRPQHLIEVVVESGQYFGYGGDHTWEKFLRKHKFRRVSTFVNSNSNNTVLVFHKQIGQPKKAKPVADPFATQEGE